MSWMPSIAAAALCNAPASFSLPPLSHVVFRYAAARAAIEQAVSESMVEGREQKDSGDNGISQNATPQPQQLQQTMQQHASDDEKDKVAVPLVL